METIRHYTNLFDSDSKSEEIEAKRAVSKIINAKKEEIKEIISKFDPIAKKYFNEFNLECNDETVVDDIIYNKGFFNVKGHTIDIDYGYTVRDVYETYYYFWFEDNFKELFDTRLLIDIEKNLKNKINEANKELQNLSNDFEYLFKKGNIYAKQ